MNVSPCCDLHGRTCEPPSELCCNRCAEAAHQLGDAQTGYHMADGSVCANPDLSPRWWDGTPANATTIIDWVLRNGGTARYRDESDWPGAVTAIMVDTAEGSVAVLPGEWVRLLPLRSGETLGCTQLVGRPDSLTL